MTVTVLGALLASALAASPVTLTATHGMARLGSHLEPAALDAAVAAVTPAILACFDQHQDAFPDGAVDPLTLYLDDDRGVRLGSWPARSAFQDTELGECVVRAASELRLRGGGSEAVRTVRVWVRLLPSTASTDTAPPAPPTADPRAPEVFAGAPSAGEPFESRGRWTRVLRLDGGLEPTTTRGGPGIVLFGTAEALVYKNGNLGATEPILGAELRLVDASGATRGSYESNDLGRFGGGLLPCEAGSTLWLGAAHPDTGAWMGPALPLSTEVDGCEHALASSSLDAALGRGDLAGATMGLWDFAEADRPAAAARVCKVLGASDALPGDEALAIWLNVEAAGAVCPVPPAVRATWGDPAAPSARWEQATLAMRLAERPEALGPVFCGALRSWLSPRSPEEGSRELEEAVLFGVRRAASLHRPVAEALACIDDIVLERSLATLPQACAAWSDGRGKEEEPAIWASAHQWAPYVSSSGPSEVSFTGDGRIVRAPAGALGALLGDPPPDVRAGVELAACRELSLVLDDEQTFALEEPEAEGDAPRPQEPVLANVLSLRLLQLQGGSCAATCAGATLKRHFGAIRDHLRAASAWEQQARERAYERAAAELVSARMDDNLPTYAGLHDGAQRSLLEGSLQVWLLRAHKAACLSGREDAKRCASTAAQTWGGEHWDVPLPPWGMDVDEHAARFCRDTLPTMRELPSAEELAGASDGDYECCLEITEDGELAVSLEGNQHIQNAGQLRAGWNAAWPAAWKAASEDLCSGLGGLTLGFLRTTCEGERGEPPGNCLATREACGEIVRGWCR